MEDFLFYRDMETKEIYKFFQICGKVEIDTRKIDGDCIYFALKGDRFDGSDFVYEALEKGASYAVSEREFDKDDKRFIVVEDCLLALQNLARHHRRQFSIPFIAVTGSNGKTTTKELLASVLNCKFKVHSTKGNFNNQIGVPLTLLSIKKDTELAIIEMGANKLGDIKELCLIAEPTHGMITNVGHAHLEGFGSFENVKKGKSELYDFLCDKGVVFLNKQEEHLSNLLCNKQKIVSWCMQQDDCISDYSFECNSQTPVSVGLHHAEGDYIIDTNLNGFHNYKNVISAVAVGLFFEVPINKIRTELFEFLPAANRSEIVKKGDITFVLDAYNANPTSMKASLLAFANTSVTKKIIVLGDMMELGNYSKDSHIEVLNYAIELGFANIVTVGNQFKIASQNFTDIESYISIEKLKKKQLELEWKGYTVLLKGSRAIQIETLLDIL
jgi:UDP-N-acetylmuramoyl-tripeptide--D-alanyl-D-alanine ligase